MISTIHWMNPYSPFICTQHHPTTGGSSAWKISLWCPLLPYGYSYKTSCASHL